MWTFYRKVVFPILDLDAIVLQKIFYFTDIGIHRTY